MTAIIDSNFQRIVALNPITPKYDQNSGPKSHLRTQNPKFQVFHSQNCLSVTIKETFCAFNLLFTLNATTHFTFVKIHLLRSDGNIVKITSQQSKTYLIRKFHQFSDLYAPRIDPSTGAIYFDLDYFELSLCRTTFSESDMKILYDNINQEKLCASIEKFSSFYKGGQYNNWDDSEFQEANKYQQLSKSICSVNDSDLMQILSLNLRHNQENAAQDSFKSQTGQLIYHLNNFYTSQKFEPEYTNKQHLFTKIKQLESEAGNLSSLTKRKQGKSNFQPLAVNYGTQKQIKQVIFKMSEANVLRTSMTVVENKLGKITLNIEKEEEAVYHAKVGFLNHLPKNTEYYFLDKYFKSLNSLPYMISLSLKDETVHRFLVTNSICISLETKMRILLQVCTAVHTLWQEKNIILSVGSFRKIHITKNLTVKFRNFANSHKVDPHMMLEEKADVNLRLFDNWLRLSKLYFKLFYQFDVGYVRPGDRSELGLMSKEQKKESAAEKRIVGAKLVPEGIEDPTKTMLIGLNYIFLSFIDKAGKMYRNQGKKKQTLKEICMNLKSVQEQENQQETTKRLLSYKLMCCWLLKNYEMVTNEVI